MGARHRPDVLANMLVVVSQGSIMFGGTSSQAVCHRRHHTWHQAMRVSPSVFLCILCSGRLQC